MTTTVSELGEKNMTEILLSCFRFHQSNGLPFSSLAAAGHPRFFLGTDSAPHPRNTKECAISHAGVFTQPYLMPYLAHILEGFGALDKLESFACENGRKFYGFTQEKPREMLKLVKQPLLVPDELKYVDDDGKPSSVVPFLAGQTLNWSLA